MKKELRLSCKVRTCFFVVLSSVLFLIEVGAQHFECAYDLLPLEEAPHPHDSVGYCYNRLKTCDSPDYFPFYQNWSALDTAVIRLNFHFIKTGDYGLNFGPTSGNCDTCYNNSVMNGYAIADSMVNMLNRVAKSLWVYTYTEDNSPALDINGFPVPYIQDSRLRFELYEENGEGAVHFHEVSNHKYVVSTSMFNNVCRNEFCKDGQVQGPPKIGNQNITKYGEKVIDVYLYDEWFPVEGIECITHYDSLNNPIYTSSGCRSLRGATPRKNYLDLGNMWWYWKENGGTIDVFHGYVGTLFHEIGHMLGLGHTFENGMPCDAKEPSGANYTWNYSTNVMGYNNHQRALSPGQLDIMFNSIYSKKHPYVAVNYSNDSYCEKESGLDTITGNVVWDEDRIVNKDILVKTGSRLKIENSCIMFGYRVYIHVERGAELVVVNSELKSACTAVMAYTNDLTLFDRRWGGIKVMGNANMNHPTNYGDPIAPASSGRVILSDHTVIENAAVAISDDWTLTYSPENWGGYMHVTDTRFKNCFKAAAFMCRDLWLNNSKFINCDIEVESGWPLNSHGISIWKASGIEITHCTFTNLSHNAIKTIDGGFAAHSNIFTGIEGIAVDVSSIEPVFTSYVTIGGESATERNIFLYNKLGIRIEGYGKGSNTIRYNEFTSHALNNQHKGIELVRSRAVIQNNKFHNQYNAVGVHAANKLDVNIEENDFENFSTGIFFKGNNSRARFLCNFLDGNKYAGVHVGDFMGIPDQGDRVYSNANLWSLEGKSPGALDIKAAPLHIDDPLLTPLSLGSSFTYYVQEDELPSSIRRPKCNMTLACLGNTESYRTDNSRLNEICQSIGVRAGKFDHLGLAAVDYLLDSLRINDTAYVYNSDYRLLEATKYTKILDSLIYLVGLEDYITASLLIANEHKFDYKVLSYGLQLAASDLVKADLVLNEMELNFTEEEALDYVEVQRINLKHLNDYTYVADSTEMMLLDEVSGKMSLAGSNARAMLTLWTDTLFAPILDHPVWDTLPPPLKEENYTNISENRITVYPNPGYGIFVLETDFSVSGEREVVEVILYNLRGMEVDRKKYVMSQGGKTELSYGHCRSGVYILEVRSGRDVERTRLVIIN